MSDGPASQRNTAPGLRAGYRLSFVLDPDGRIRSVSEATGIDGWPSEGYVGRTLAEVSAERAGPERGDTWHVRIERAKDADRPVTYLDTVPGAPLDDPPSVGAVVTPVRAADGTLQAIIVELEDRSAVGRSRLQLETSEARLRGIAETVPGLVWESDGAGNMRWLSPRWEAFVGRAQRDLLGHGYVESVHPEDRAFLAAVEGGPSTAEPIPFRLRRADGRYRWMEAHLEVVRDADGTPQRTIGTAMDVTGRRAMEHDAREVHEQLVRALGITGLGRYAITAPEGELELDERCAEILGLDRARPSGQSGLAALRELVDPRDVDLFDAAADAAMRGDADLTLELRIRRPGPDGAECRWISVHGRLDREGDGPPRLLGLVKDVTDRRRADEDRVRAQKREMVGTLVGGIAHDFNNLLGAILSNAAVARAELKAGAPVEDSIAEIERGARRAAELVRRVLAQAREEEEPEAGPVDVAAVVAEVCDLLRPGLPAGVALAQAVAHPLPVVLGDATQLHQLVVNLVTNAAQAIGNAGGTIEVGADRDGDELVLVVSDDGPGMTAAVRGRIFDPYFTTKGSGEGTGLGLAAVQTIARSHGATIAVTSEPGEGATFTVRFPVADMQPARPAIPEPEPERQAAAGAPPARILVVDDEPSLVRLAERALPPEEFAVTGFVDSGAALDAFDAGPRRFDGLVTDLSMPGLDGLELIARIRRTRPELPVVLTSGFLTAENRALAEELHVDRIVSKPCSIVDLVSALRSALEA